MKKYIYPIFLILIFKLIPVQAQTWAWAKSCKSSTPAPTQASDANSIACDPSGNVFITGSFAAGAMSTGSVNLSTSATGQCFYLIKYDASGNAIWGNQAATISASPSSIGMFVSSDAVGNAIVTGIFSDSLLVAGTHTLTNTGINNIFLAKYSTGGSLLWIQNPTDTSGTAISYGVSSDASNNIYVSGTFSNTAIIFGTHTLTSVGSEKYFLVKYDPNGNVLWAKCNTSGSIFDDTFTGVSVSTDAGGNSYITGSFTSANLVAGTFTLTNSGAQNIFVAKYDPSGNVIWLKSATGTGSDQSTSISFDGTSNFYVTGYYGSSSLNFGTSTLINSSMQNMFLAKYDVNGNNVWARTSANTTNPQGMSVSSNSLNVFVGGTMLGSPVNLGSFTITANPATSNAFLARYDVTGNIQYATSLDASGDDWVGVAADENCNVYFNSDFSLPSIILGNDTLKLNGSENTFTSKLTFSCQVTNGIVAGNSSETYNYIIYPNPSSGAFIIDAQADQGDTESLFYDVTGNLIFRQSIRKGKNYFQFNNQPDGIYFYKIRTRETEYSGKVLIQK